MLAILKTIDFIILNSTRNITMSKPVTRYNVVSSPTPELGTQSDLPSTSGGDISKNERTFQALLTKFMRKDEMSLVKKFKTGNNIEKHLRTVAAKMDELRVEDDDKGNVLLDTLDERVKHEIFALPNFKQNKSSYEWIVRNLRHIFHSKLSKVNPLVELLQIKQLPQQKLRDFVSAIRVEAWRIMGEEDEEKREEFCVTAFIDGLYNRRCGVALKQLLPKTLEEAYSMVKHEDSENAHEENMRLIASAPYDTNLEQTITSMASEIKNLKNQINILATEIAKLSRPSYADRARQPPRLPEKMAMTRPQGGMDEKRQTVCYNCNKTGHIARGCPSPTICRYCKATGHNILQCTLKPRERPQLRYAGNLRNLQNDEDAIDSASIETSNRYALLDVEDEDNTAPSISYLGSDVKAMQTPQPKPRRSLQKKQNGDPDISRWTNYINGNGVQPKKFHRGSRTVISKSNKELSANKPIVPCRINGHQKNVFFDSGCDNNVIDQQFATQLGLSISEQRGQLNCANSTPLHTLGYTFMKLTIGSRTIECKFTVAEKIFPNVFIGLRSMKRERISIHPERDSIYINGERVEFLSKIETQEN